MPTEPNAAPTFAATRRRAEAGGLAVARRVAWLALLPALARRAAFKCKLRQPTGQRSGQPVSDLTSRPAASPENQQPAQQHGQRSAQQPASRPAERPTGRRGGRAVVFPVRTSPPAGRAGPPPMRQPAVSSLSHTPGGPVQRRSNGSPTAVQRRSNGGPMAVQCPTAVQRRSSGGPTAVQ